MDERRLHAWAATSFTGSLPNYKSLPIGVHGSRLYHSRHTGDGFPAPREAQAATLPGPLGLAQSRPRRVVNRKAILTRQGGFRGRADGFGGAKPAAMAVPRSLARVGRAVNRAHESPIPCSDLFRKVTA